MDTSIIPEKEYSVWTLQNDSIIIEIGDEKFILNQTTKLVWELIDGVSTVEEIIKQIIDKYGNLYSAEHISDLTYKALEILKHENMIKFIQKNDFDGWLKYE